MAPAVIMFKKKINKFFSGMPNVFSIADDILVVGFDELGRDHDVTLDKGLRICSQTNLKLNKHKCLFNCNSICFFGEVISKPGISLYPRKVQALTDMPPL